MSTRELLKLAGYEVARANHTDEAERAAILIDQLSPRDRKLAVRLIETLLERDE